jgi:hypothetical protein
VARSLAQYFDLDIPMDSKQAIFLSFFEVDKQDFQYTVYRRPYQHGETKEDNPALLRYKLPIESTLDLAEAEYKSYWVGFEQAPGLEKFVCRPPTNNALSCEYLYRLLERTCRRILSCDEYRLPDQDKHRKRRIEFVLEAYDLGSQFVWLEPYFLKSKQLFGFLLDFGFHPKDDARSIETLKLSLSLDANGKSNKGYYADRYGQVRIFIDRFAHKVFRIDDDIEILPLRRLFDDELLRSKQYEIGSSRTSTSQFLGVKNHGPVKAVGERTQVHFVFSEYDRPLSNRLYFALNGKSFPSQFPGMNSMFGCQFDHDTVTGASIQDFTLENVLRTLDQIKNQLVDGRILPVFVSPFDESNEDDLYYHLKHRCLQLNSPCQFVSTRLLSDKYQLKWATSNIALQLFAKMGGEPWLVTPRSQSCLVIGLGQAHSREHGPAKKYFAYTVLTDSSGRYKDLKILGDDCDFSSYIVNFEHRLKEVLESYYDHYERFVIHSTFRVRNREVRAVEDVVTQMDARAGGTKEFVVMKFNERNKYFAYASEGNSMTPYESSILRLSHDEYLVWFEGLQFHNPNLKARIRRPVHVQFLHSNRRLDSSRKRDYIQDAVNISGANWRGFNAKSLPISISYAYLIAKFYREFQRLGFAEIDWTVSPWFL